MDGSKQLFSTQLRPGSQTLWRQWMGTMNHNEKQWALTVPSILLHEYILSNATLKQVRYYLDVKKYDKLDGIEWYVVTLFDQKQFLGNTAAYFLYVYHSLPLPILDTHLLQEISPYSCCSDCCCPYVSTPLCTWLITLVIVTVVTLVTYGTTNPLFVLANDLQKMAQLDMNISDMKTPRVCHTL